MAAGAVIEGGELRAHLVELERLRSELFSTVAHELRTPLTAFAPQPGCCSIRRRGPRPSSASNCCRPLSAMRSNCNDWLTPLWRWRGFVRARPGSSCVALTRASWGMRSWSALAPLLDAKDQHMALALGEQPVWVFADHRRIERAIVNLVSNAHKFSKPGSEIRFAVRRAADDVCWEVADDGHGIAEEERPLLFERFFVSASDRSPGGIGLGLPIALFTAQAHGGPWSRI